MSSVFALMVKQVDWYLGYGQSVFIQLLKIAKKEGKT